MGDTFYLTVTNLNNGGAGSLRNAIKQAQSGSDSYVISFDKSLKQNGVAEINLKAGLVIQSGKDILINGDVDGDGEADFAISGDTDKNGFSNAGDLGVMLTIESGANLTLQSFDVQDGFALAADHSGFGPPNDAVAGIVNRGNLYVHDSRVENHYAAGGASYSYGPASGVNGGRAVAGIYSTGILEVTDSSFFGNGAAGNAGVDAPSHGGYGGNGVAGIFVAGGTAHLHRVWGSYQSAVGGAGGDGANQAGNGGNAASLLYAASGATYGTIGYGSSMSHLGGASGVPGPSGAAGISGAQGVSLYHVSVTSNINLYGPGPSSLFGTDGHDNVSIGYQEAFYGMHGDDVINNLTGGSGIAFGGAGSDVIITTGLGVVAKGGAGEDMIIVHDLDTSTLDGGSGIDTLDLSNDQKSINFDMKTGQVLAMAGSAINFENFIGVDDANFSDQIQGTNGNNVISGLAGDDVLNGRNGNDLLKGGQGIDELNGDNGRDVLLGGKHIDLLNGGKGRDKLDGGKGNDYLKGGKDNDILIGRGGKDQFFFAANVGRDVIKDFQDGKDKLDFSGFGFANKKQALSFFSEMGSANNNVVKFNVAGTFIKIKGVDLGDISGADIII